MGYQSDDQIRIDSITHRNGSVIKPRTTKSKKEQAIRVRDKAEVFTPSWVCNSQNNLVDSAWFGKENVFNTESEQTWITAKDKITFPEEKTWQDYVKANRMEISCGEAPYLVSRYDTVTGKWICGYNGGRKEWRCCKCFAVKLRNELLSCPLTRCG